MRALWMTLVVAACAGGTTEVTDRWVDPIALERLSHDVWLPGSRVFVTGQGFSAARHGTARVQMHGEIDGRAVDLSVRAERVDDDTLAFDVDPDLVERLAPFDGALRGGVRIEVERPDALQSTSNALRLDVRLARSLPPRVSLTIPRVVHANHPIGVRGEGLLGGDGEGTTWARVRGCWFAAGDTECVAAEAVRVPVVPDDVGDRSAGSFAFSPHIAGVRPGSFRGTVEIENAHGPLSDGLRLSGGSFDFEAELAPPAVTTLDAASASIGRIVHVEGVGFVGPSERSLTTLELSGTFRSHATGDERSIDVLLIPEFSTGQRLRWVVDENGPLGEQINMRRERGTLSGTLTPIVRWGDDEVRGSARAFRLDVTGVKQVVFLSFDPSWAESLRNYGLRAVEPLVRRRTIEAAAEPYAGVDVELRDELPTEWALYAHVDVVGPDPNGQGLFGYDNTPGKDTNNLRLHDRIGGVNATTQADGFPGYGGVFVDSFLGFSTDPGRHAQRLPMTSPRFDEIFDPFRPDRGGQPVTADDLRELGAGVARAGRACPAARSDRPAQIACAVWVLGNLAGGTIAHEIGHSLGLAYPDDDGFHNAGDEPNRLMDSGSARPFEERAVLDGQGPAQLCDDAYAYLRELMPEPGDDPLPSRTGCH